MMNLKLDFSYVAHNVPGIGANLDEFETPATHRCSCYEQECSFENGCSCLPFGNVYDKHGLLILPIGSNVPVTECNSNCSCVENSFEAKCRNRVVQNGVSVPLDVFLTPDKGYGLKSLSRLPPGQFVCEYAGEIISLQEAKRRYEILSSNSDSNYIFVLREHVNGADSERETIVTCVDANAKGNLGRFMNHSCNPNTYIVPVRFDSVVPRLALFTNRNVDEGDELCYSYGSHSFVAQTDSEKQKLCRCMSECCTGTLPYEDCLFD